jgi:hypothetical protein
MLKTFKNSDLSPCSKLIFPLLKELDMSRWSKLSVIILLWCLNSAAAANMDYQPANPVWQKEFEYSGFACIPQLLAIKNDKEIIVIGTMLNMRDFNAVGRIWQWTLDKKTGERLDDMTIKSAKRNDCGALSQFWPSKGLDVIDDNETQLLIFSLERGETQSLIRYRKGRTSEKYEINTKAAGNDIFAARIKRINPEEYFIYGSGPKDQNAVLQKRINNNEVVWEKLYHYGSWSSVSDIARSHFDGRIAITGWARDDNHKSGNAWINVIDRNGTVLAKEEFDINSASMIYTPQIGVLDNNNIAVVYNRAFEGQVTNIEYRIYSPDLKLKCKASVAVSKMDFLHYGMATINGGFVIVHNVFEPDIQYEILNQYDCDGKKVRSIKLDGVGGLGGDQIVIEGKGKTVYIALLKSPVLPPLKTVITALDLGQ